MTHPGGALSLLTHPYRRLTPFEGGRTALKDIAAKPGSALIWAMGPRVQDPGLVEKRPGGLALIIVLPEAEDIHSDPNLIMVVQKCRPQGILPYHLEPRAAELAQVLRRPPIDLAAEVTDYMTWRGLGLDRETTRMVRRILELSGDIKSVTALSRGMYISRRALGRRLMKQGLPVPSHWLQLGRLLRLAVKLQNSESSLFSLACEAGYPDGFSVSNQMHRLVGYRPSQVREYLGWEWLLEEWLRREAESGGLSPTVRGALSRGGRSMSKPSEVPPPRRGRPSRSRQAPA